MKEGCHLSTKVNPDGSKSALQFSDDTNTLLGPVDLIEIDKEDLIRTKYIVRESPSRSLKECVLEDIIVPELRLYLDKASEFAMDFAVDQVKTTVIPTVKAFRDKLQLIVATIKGNPSESVLKVDQVLKAHDECQRAAPALQNNDATEKEPHSEEEIQEVVNIMRSSSIVLAACIKWLNNTVVEDGETKRTLSSADVKRQIDSLLECKDQDFIDQKLLEMLIDLRQRNLLVEGQPIPTSRHLSKEHNQ